MSEAPETIWMAEFDSPASATWGLGMGVPYIRSDLANKEIQKLLDKIESLENELRKGRDE